MHFFSSDKRLQEIFFKNHPPPRPHPPQELNGGPLKVSTAIAMVTKSLSYQRYNVQKNWLAVQVVYLLFLFAKFLLLKLLVFMF